MIEELDRKVRLFAIPKSLLVPGFGGAKATTEVEGVPVELTMQRYIAFAIKEMSEFEVIVLLPRRSEPIPPPAALFYMHRGYFAQAMEDNPNDPLGTKYASSVLASYNSAWAFVGLIESLFNQHPVLTERMWFLFTHVFSCAVSLHLISLYKAN